MVFLSGALFPVSGLPAWLEVLMPPLLEAGMVLLLGLAMVGVATRRFSRTE
jgi:xanthine/uracil permease